LKSFDLPENHERTGETKPDFDPGGEGLSATTISKGATQVTDQGFTLNVNINAAQCPNASVGRGQADPQGA
jgi:hypothetical protein